MRVAHFSRYFLPHYGGTERYIASLARATSHRIEHVVVCTDRSGPLANPPPGVSKVVHLRATGPEFKPIAIYSWVVLPRLLRDVDLVVVHDIRFVFGTVRLLARLLHRPVLVTTHGLFFHTQRRRLLKRIFGRVYLALLRKVEGVIAVSDVDRETLRRVGVNAVLFENPVDLSRFEEARTIGLMHHNEGAGVTRLVYFGRLDVNKGLLLLLDALDGAEFEWMLTMVGSGEPRYESLLRHRAERLTGTVEFVGSVPDAELVRHLVEADCIVLPSQHEAFGLVYVEALASGTPVVASDIPAFRSIRGDSCLPLVDFSDGAAVLAAIESASVEFPASAARERSRHYSWHRRSDDLVALYERFAQQERGESCAK